MLAGMWHANTQSLLIVVVYSMWLAYNYTCTSASGVINFVYTGEYFCGLLTILDGILTAFDLTRVW